MIWPSHPQCKILTLPESCTFAVPLATHQVEYVNGSGIGARIAILVRPQGGNARTMTGSHEHVELPSVVRWGRWLLGASLAALAIGGAIVNVFFPRQLGRGLDVLTLSILIPIWAAGIAGILLLLLAWVRYPGLNTKLEVGIPIRPDGRLFGPFTKSLACCTLVLVWLASLTLWTESDEMLPLWKKGFLFYCVTAYCWFLLYLTVLYSSAKHHATTTYLNHYSPLIGTLLVPLTWGLLIGLNWMVVRRAGKAANSDLRRRETEDRAEPDAAADGGRDLGLSSFNVSARGRRW